MEAVSHTLSGSIHRTRVALAEEAKGYAYFTVSVSVLVLRNRCVLETSATWSSMSARTWLQLMGRTPAVEAS